jgi:hypothetical protein
VLKYVCVTTEPANQLVLLSSVNNSLHVLQCKMNSRCYPPCKSCWSNYTYTWYERLSPGVSEASVIDGVTSESFNLAVTLPDGRGYYCSTTVAGTGTVSSVNTFWRKYKWTHLGFMFHEYCFSVIIVCAKIYRVKNVCYVCRCVSPK